MFPFDVLFLKYAEELLKYVVYRDPDLVKRIGAATALEVRATGIQYTFAPCIAVNSSSCCKLGLRNDVHYSISTFD